MNRLNIESAFESTCKILFGMPVGTLNEFDPYLREATVGKEVKSSISGKLLKVLSSNYPDNARFFDYNAEFGKLASLSKLSKPLNISQLKDIDSLFSAVEEKIIYSGNKVLGNSNDVYDSDDVVDGSFVHHSTYIRNGKFVYCCYLMNEPEYCFGSASSGQSQYIMRCFYNNTLKRCFECCTSVGSSDLYFCYNLIGCHDCLFTFSVRNKTNMIANVQLSKEQYAELKNKLVGEIAEELRSKKKLGYSIIDLLNRNYD